MKLRLVVEYDMDDDDVDAQIDDWRQGRVTIADIEASRDQGDKSCVVTWITEG